MGNRDSAKLLRPVTQRTMPCMQMFKPKAIRRNAWGRTTLLDNSSISSVIAPSLTRLHDDAFEVVLCAMRAKDQTLSALNGWRIIECKRLPPSMVPRHRKDRVGVIRRCLTRILP